MNTFGTASTGGQYPLFDARLVKEYRKRFGREPIPMLDRANGIYVPTGRWPARGWLLIRREDYDALNKYGTAFELNVGDPSKVDNVGTLKHLRIVQAQCVSRGVAADEDAIYLVEVTDGRGIVCNEWFQFPLNSQYNIRAPAYPQTFHPASMNSGTTWTWSTMLQDIWNRMSVHLGAWPGLPYAPAGTPEGFWFVGVSAWTSMCDILDYLGMKVACDLTAASPYTIVRSGSADASFTTTQNKYGATGATKYRLEDDLEWVDVGAGRVPRYVTVIFRRRNSVYGTEETVYYGNDGVAKQWSMAATYSVDVDAPAAFSSATGTHYIWSDFTVRADDSGNPLDADVHEARVIARERATQYYEHIDPAEFMTQTYIGALPFTTGSRVDGVCWFQDCRRSDRTGWRTQIVRGANPPWPGLWS